MATRAIVTSQPVVACDVCGRRLLRGETPDVFLAGAQRRTVCELCVPRAAAEGWLREADQHDLSVRPARPRRGGSLLGRLRQLREGEEPLRRQTARSARRQPIEEGLYEVEDPVYDFLGGETQGESATDGQAIYIGALGAERSSRPEALDAVDSASLEAAADVQVEPVGGERFRLERALEVFNGGEVPQRIAGVSRSLGEPSIVVRALEDADAAVAILVAWELCWYRYEVDPESQEAGARLVAEGTELGELAPQDRAANALADERGRVALARG